MPYLRVYTPLRDAGALAPHGTLVAVVPGEPLRPPVDISLVAGGLPEGVNVFFYMQVGGGLGPRIGAATVWERGETPLGAVSTTLRRPGLYTFVAVQSGVGQVATVTMLVEDSTRAHGKVRAMAGVMRVTDRGGPYAHAEAASIVVQRRTSGGEWYSIVRGGVVRPGEMVRLEASNLAAGILAGKAWFRIFKKGASLEVASISGIPVGGDNKASAELEAPEFEGDFVVMIVQDGQTKGATEFGVSSKAPGPAKAPPTGWDRVQTLAVLGVAAVVAVVVVPRVWAPKR